MNKTAATRVIALMLAPTVALTLAAPAEAGEARRVASREVVAKLVADPTTSLRHVDELPYSKADIAQRRAARTLKANLVVGDTTLSVNRTTTFSTRGSVAKRGVKRVTIRFGDGAVASSRKLRFTRTHGYAKPGSYTVTVTVRDTSGRKANARRIILVSRSVDNGLGAQTPDASNDVRITDELAPGAGAGAPASADLRSSAIEVGNQGSIGSCVSWTTAYAMMGYYYKHKTGQSVKFAPMYTYSQTYKGLDASGQPNGSFASDALEVLRTQGVDTAAHYGAGWATQWNVTPNASQRANAANYKISGWATLFSHSNLAGATSAEIEAMKGQLAAGHPVAIAFRVRQDFTSYRSGWYAGSGAYSNGLHEMLAMGYDANGLIIQNSWGTGHGVNGYVYMTWDAVRRDLYEATYAHGLVTTSNNGGSDTTAPTITSFGKRFSVDYMANNSQAPMTFTWAGSDNVGVSKYLLYYRLAGGEWYQLAIDDKATSATYNLSFNTSYEFAVAAYDGAGNLSSWAYTGAFTPGNYAESVAGYSGQWYSYNSSSYLGGTSYESSQAGAQMSVQVTGTNFGLVGTKGPMGGKADVYLDGVYQFTVDNYRASAGYRMVVAWFNFGSRSTHTVTLKVQGTSGRPYVGVDSFLLS